MNYKAALVGLGVVAVAALVALGVLFVTTEQKKSDKVTTWSNTRLLTELESQLQGAVDCAALGFQGLEGTAYIDEANRRIILMCVVPESPIAPQAPTTTG